MSWLFSQELVVDYLVHDCSDGKPSAQLSGNPTAKLHLHKDRTKDCSKLSRYGMTYQHLTEQDGEVLLMWYLADSLAKTSQLQTKTQKESKEVDQDFGPSSQELFGKYDPNTHSLKTAPCSSAVDSMLSLATLPKWGSMLDGELFQPKMSVQITCEKDAGSLPETKTTNESFPTPRAKEPGRTTKGYGRGLAELVEGKEQVNKKEKFPTPIAQDASKLPSNGLARLVETGKRYSDGHFKNQK